MFFKEWFESRSVNEKEKMQKEYQEICDNIRAIPKKHEKLEKEHLDLKKQQLAMSQELSKL